MFKYLIPVLFSLLIGSSSFADQDLKKDFNIATNKVILKFDGKSLNPPKLTLKKIDSSIFFINTSENKDVHLDIDFNDKKLHCHSDNLKLVNNHIKTTSPIKPRDFEILCFPSPGVYQYTVREDSSKGTVFRGEVNVQE